jgi:hypothetical protein
MIEMATVLILSGVLMIIAYELSYSLSRKRAWGENYRGFF